MDFEEKKNKTKQINKLKTLRNSRTVCRYVQLRNVSVMTINQLWLVEFKSDLIEFFHHFMNSLSIIKNMLHEIHNFCTVFKKFLKKGSLFVVIYMFSTAT
jgi:hypothetical protein